MEKWPVSSPKGIIRARRTCWIGLAADIRVSELMTPQVAHVSPDYTAEDCMALVTEMRVRHLPVLENNNVVGLVSIGDLVKDSISGQQFIIHELERYIYGVRGPG